MARDGLPEHNLRVKVSLLLVISFAITVQAQSATTWFDRVRELADEALPNREQKLEQLQKIPNLETLVCGSLKERRYEEEAFQAIMLLHMQACWGPLFQSAKENYGWHEILTLEELNRQKPRVEWRKWLRSTVAGTDWSSLDGSGKLAILSAIMDEKIELSTPTLKKLLSDSDPEVRKSALLLVGEYIEQSPRDKETRRLLRRSFSTSPLQVRLVAYQLISRFPASTRAEFASDLKKCVQSEHVTRVKTVCQKLQSLR